MTKEDFCPSKFWSNTELRNRNMKGGHKFWSNKEREREIERVLDVLLASRGSS